MNVRTLQPSDLDAALRLWQRTEHLATVTREEVEGVLDHDAGLVLVAERDDRLVGVVLGTYDGRRGWIQRLAVDAEARRGGVAKTLIEELERRLVERGCTQVNLLVFDDNQTGRTFWEQIGYQGTERLVMYRRRLDEREPASYPAANGQVER